MGIFDRFRPRPKTKATGTRTNLAMVPLRTSIPVSWTRIDSATRSLFPTFPSTAPIDGSQDPDRESDVDAATVPIPGGSIMMGYMPHPIPWDDLDWPVRTAWHWSEAESRLKPHQAHLIVLASSDTFSQVQLTSCLTQAIAGAVSASDAAGVYYGNASIVVEPEAYVEQAQSLSPTHLPLPLWLGFHPVAESKGLSGYTTGMEVFELLNLEAHDTTLSPPELLGRLADTAHYQILNGLQIQDGETIGDSAEERISVRHRRSRFGARETTCQLGL